MTPLVHVRLVAPDPNGVHLPGEVLLVDAARAAAWVAHGCAVYLDGRASRVETAMTSPPENTMRPRARAKRKGVTQWMPTH